MSLDKNDLKEITKIVDASEQRLNKKFDSVDKKIDLVDKKVDSVKNEIISIISREVTDLAEINRAVIEKVDLIGELDKRITRLEANFGVKPV